MQSNKIALIFDMDGVVVDNTKYHILAWQRFFKNYGRSRSRAYVVKKVLGRFNREIFKTLFKKEFSVKESRKLAEEKEALYRKLYTKAIRPLAGLSEFLKHLKSKNIKIALATAAPPVNVKWVLRMTGLKKYFKVIVDDTGVARGKPSPDIFLKVAKKLKIRTESCIVFEDSMLGIEAANMAGMKVIGVATSHKPKELKDTDLVIKDFKNFTLKMLEWL
ncbi:MAG: HAD family phosphatase [Candidatus Doudnabacteria bacterium]|nr:HAD family phosphatase [Candidatus Doudnabacteria bacterium]